MEYSNRTEAMVADYSFRGDKNMRRENCWTYFGCPSLSQEDET